MVCLDVISTLRRYERNIPYLGGRLTRQKAAPSCSVTRLSQCIMIKFSSTQQLLRCVLLRLAVMCVLLSPRVLSNALPLCLSCKTPRERQSLHRPQETLEDSRLWDRESHTIASCFLIENRQWFECLQEANICLNAHSLLGHFFHRCKR